MHIQITWRAGNADSDSEGWSRPCDSAFLTSSWRCWYCWFVDYSEPNRILECKFPEARLALFSAVIGLEESPAHIYVEWMNTLGVSMSACLNYGLLIWYECTTNVTGICPACLFKCLITLSIYTQELSCCPLTYRLFTVLIFWVNMALWIPQGWVNISYVLGKDWKIRI